ncbi:hypothetical protein AC629_21805 [Bradyrhizobium sp. NAS80.1]|nr:hypothetical protein AC629_21805 [Bradyrhizobium sp. NAS80.1]
MLTKFGQYCFSIEKLAYRAFDERLVSIRIAQRSYRMRTTPQEIKTARQIMAFANCCNLLGSI